jgi:hypothetical protein
LFGDFVVIHRFSTAIHTQFRSKSVTILPRDPKPFTGKGFGRKMAVDKRKIEKIGKIVWKRVIL